MRKQNGFKEENIMSFIREIVMPMTRVYAEEDGAGGDSATNPDATPDDGDNTQTKVDAPKTPSINYEDLISKARKEEKDKLYPKITALEKENGGLVEKHNKALLTIGELQTSIEDLEANKNSSTKGVSDEVAKLKKELAEKETELKTLEETTLTVEEVEERVRKEVEEEYEVKLYREQKLREVGDEVIPELVTGTSKEEIDNSLTVAQQRFNDIVGKTLSGVKIPPANTNTSKLNTKEYSLEDLAKLDPRSAEYKELRTKLGLK